MVDINLKEYIPTIRTILEESDLNVITAKDVRVKLEEQYKVDLTSRKLEVQKITEEFEDTKVKIEDTKEINGERTKKASSQKTSKKTGKTKGRPPKSKQVNNIVTPTTTNNGTDTSSIDDDRHSDFNMANNNKKKRGRKPKNPIKSALNASDDETNNNGTPNGKKSSKSKNGDIPKKKKFSNKRKKTEELEDNDGEAPPKKRKGNTGIHKPLLLSPVLSAFLGQEELSRLEVVKRLWTYIKENNLQDPKDKRYIICDEKLMHIFGKDRMHSFTMNKYLTVHLKKKDDTSGFPPSVNDQGNSSIAGGDEEHEEFSGDQADDTKMEDLLDSLLSQADETKTDYLFGDDDNDNGWGEATHNDEESEEEQPASSMKVESSEE
ncbi:2700_t:CDS:2 [Ambispora gerdemannii]|uniref:2700_t:CDS:1 n=1 Tax=Ambispora gerdemannii TaxID=144530 RepID=A0A9N8V3M9_9GLOM|nr:2700_t:CDS:2 [Ambispora gerdemannii]